MKLYVGNLAFSTTDADLREAFSQFGTVTDSVVIMDRETGRSRGFGFIEISDDNAGREAISGMDGKDLDGRNLKVNEARPREERGSGGGGRW